jgi:predicted metal-dependent peptidase
MNNLTPKQRVEKAHVQMMGHQATMLYSGVFMVGKTEISETVRTACTNGRDTWYGSKFVEGLSQSDLHGLILHENLHKVYQHHWLWKHLWDEDKQLANQSADYVINLEIADLSVKYKDFITLPKGALLDERFRGMNTQEVFNILKDEQEEGGDPTEGDEFDEHDFDELTEAEKEALGKEVEQAIRQGQILAGKQGGDVSKSIKDLLEPKVNWRDQLSEFMTELSCGKDDSTWRRPNRRWLQHDIYLPSSISESMGCLAVIRDTSGSVDDLLASIFFSELVALVETVKPSLIHVIDCDADIQGHRIFDESNYHTLRDARDLKGGGGTDMRVAFDYIVEKNLRPEAILVLTDGYTPFPTTSCAPSLWAITTDQRSPIGVTIRLEV